MVIIGGKLAAERPPDMAGRSCWFSRMDNEKSDHQTCRSRRRKRPCELTGTESARDRSKAEN